MNVETNAPEPEPRLDRIRILILDLPRMLRDLVQQALSEHPEMVVVEPPEPASEMAAAAEQADADVLVVPAPSSNELWDIDAALFRRPRLKVLGITRDGRDMHLRELCPRTVHIGNVAPRELAEAIRRMVEEEPAEC